MLDTKALAGFLKYFKQTLSAILTQDKVIATIEMWTKLSEQSL
jgi:hypothetical protein